MYYFARITHLLAAGSVVLHFFLCTWLSRAVPWRPRGRTGNVRSFAARVHHQHIAHLAAVVGTQQRVPRLVHPRPLVGALGEPICAHRARARLRRPLHLVRPSSVSVPARVRHDVRRPFPVVHGVENLRPERGGEQPQRVTLRPRLGLRDDTGKHDADVRQRTVFRDGEKPTHVPGLEFGRRRLVRYRLVGNFPIIITLRHRRGSKHRRVHFRNRVIRGVCRGGALEESPMRGGYDGEDVSELSPIAVISLIAPLAFHHRSTGLSEARR
mmetsp:Transcript_13398/g.56672  ORF Transcript_13398/g.56672 Transcript_13398/m.56672 type:complete len:269 (-) Transcript_13398:1348-2154(-)